MGERFGSRRDVKKGLIIASPEIWPCRLRCSQPTNAVIRRAYVHQMVATAVTTSPRIEAAFATVPREKFLGAPPWQIAT